MKKINNIPQTNIRVIEFEGEKYARLSDLIFQVEMTRFVDAINERAHKTYLEWLLSMQMGEENENDKN